MKAMILAAGLGNRMRPLTLHTPKPLLEVGGKPLIVWHIEKLQKVGVTEIVINTAWLGEKLANALGDGSQFGVKILWSHEGEGLETAGGIINALPLLGDEPFILVNGDVWTTMDFASLLDVQLGEQQAHLVLVENPPQHLKGDFILSNGLAYTFEQEQLGEALTYSGIAVLHPRMFAGLENGKRPLAPLLKQAMQQQQVSAEKMQAVWVDVGTPERLQQLDQHIKQGVFS
ncbi:MULTISPECIES: N-acetylmuramate alpha-1-phosphate uridylyltransferase MurU [unclassified Acinetobacter]|uniref:Nucleotidyltransferase family protein n=1 Tax=Acinetobacter corruptisaponis TaxID=3045147 RepID=A0ABY8S7G0_9GAMM|nr:MULTISPECIES: nucleotidyltransferase family protein [unclassified Acinetobacter]MDH0031962.1 nucleotidyltransferase family protein [Acinetobacter sp. GD04021]MDH0887371.1 nucleotidyltransferase family protein [Acinetobacter sp. GD03873]MDH1083966.1 nucleotidyltransferase family protein [Acinetobacter sp. GD03983]MDH2190687.1 nucleotidyltransferase family protein [Acinetobacter sp. GD03645]MDH2202177.1 nucleotidyltransferase family protein [Acinetobacter sp. GD03647]